MPPIIDMESCTACGNCAEDCPGYLIEMKNDVPVVVYPDECWHCGCCRLTCPVDCITYEFPLYTLV